MYQFVFAQILSLFLALPPLAVEPVAQPRSKTEDQPKLALYPDVTYVTMGTTKLQLDLAVPTTPGPHPCVVCFHGGAWQLGNRKDLTRPALFATSPRKKEDGLLEKFARKGYAVASVSYRLAPKHKFPAQIEDAKTAIRFLRTNAKKYDLDADHFAALGFSAGGHLAALLGTTDKADGLEGTEYPDVSSRVQCVVNFFGPTDLSLYCETPGLVDAFMVPFLGKECLQDPKLYERASPMRYVTKDDPPVLILHGTTDLIVPILHSERFQEKLQSVGVPVELIKYKGEGHGWTGELVEDSAQKTLLFLDKHLKNGARK